MPAESRKKGSKVRRHSGEAGRERKWGLAWHRQEHIRGTEYACEVVVAGEVEMPSQEEEMEGGYGGETLQGRKGSD